MRKYQSNKNQGARIQSRANWLDKGDRGPKFFFKVLKVKEAKDNIEFICEDGSVLTNFEDILGAFT